MNTKPKRENFRSDDDFGEAYALWMLQQKKAPAPTPSAAPKAQTPLPPAVTVIPVNRNLPQIPARIEAERDTWNQTTKARFMRAKEKDRMSKP